MFYLNLSLPAEMIQIILREQIREKMRIKNRLLHWSYIIIIIIISIVIIYYLYLHIYIHIWVCRAFVGRLQWHVPIVHYFLDDFPKKLETRDFFGGL